jgi:hypothetical protein
MQRFITTENLYRFLILGFVISLCVFHGKVFGIGYLRNSPSDFLAKQFYLADVFLFLALLYTLYKSEFYWSGLLTIILLITTWCILPRGSIYSYYAVIRSLQYAICFYIFFHVQIRASIYKLISYLAVIESIIGIIQFHLKHSIGLHILGEPIFNTDTNGIAKIDLSNGIKVVRAYGTFSHPNSLGAFLVIAFAFTTYLIYKKQKALYYVNLFIILLGLTVTFSRAAILGAFIYLIVFMGMIQYKKLGSKYLNLTYFGLIIIAVLVSVVSYGTYLSTRATIEDNSTVLRLQYDKEGLDIALQHPLFGVGYGNVIYAMNQIIPNSEPNWAIQPPHNYFIIVSDETGLIGLGLFIVLFTYIFKEYIIRLDKLNEAGDSVEIVSLFSLFISIIILMQFDHYFYDIPLMALLFWMTLGIISGAIQDNKIHGPMVQW